MVEDPPSNTDTCTVQNPIPLTKHFDTTEIVVSYDGSLGLNGSQNIRNNTVNSQCIGLAKLLSNSKEPKKTNTCNGKLGFSNR